MPGARIGKQEARHIAGLFSLVSTKRKSWDGCGNRHARGYGNAWYKLREQIMRRDCGVCRCSECKRLSRLRPAHEVDHIVPKAKGGTDDWDNLCAINRECHKDKSLRDKGMTPKPWIGVDGYPIER